MRTGSLVSAGGADIAPGLWQSGPLWQCTSRLGAGRAISSVVGRAERHSHTRSAARFAARLLGPLVVLATLGPAPAHAQEAQPPLLGRAGSIAVEAQAPSGTWLAFCQATRDTDGDGKLEVRSGPRGEASGDVPSLFLVLGDEVRPIDELLAFDATGRFVVVSNEGKPWLFDVELGTLTDLSPYAPDLRADEEFMLGHRALSFDANGRQLLLLRKKGRLEYQADLFDLSAGFDPKKKETLVLDRAEIWRARLSPDGKLALFEAVPEGVREGDTWPVPLRKSKLQRCHGLIANAGAWGGRNANVTRTVVSTRGGSLPAQTPGFVSTFGDSWLRREKNGRLMLVRGSTQKQLVSARCGGRIIHSDPTRELAIVSCERYTLAKPPKGDEAAAAKPKRLRARPPSKTRFDVYLVGPGYVKDLEADVGLTGLDLDPGQTPRLVPLRAGARSLLIDLDQRVSIELDTDDRVIASYGGKALVRRGAKLSVYDADKRERTHLADKVKTIPSILMSGRYAFVEPYLVDLEMGRIAGETAGAPLALSEKGRLVFAQVAPSTERWAMGPLRYVELPATAAAPATAPTAPPPATTPPASTPNAAAPSTASPGAVTPPKDAANQAPPAKPAP